MDLPLDQKAALLAVERSGRLSSGIEAEDAPDHRPALDALAAAGLVRRLAHQPDAAWYVLSGAGVSAARRLKTRLR